MGLFKHYAAYYDLFYQDKDYAGEVEFVHHLLQNVAPGASSILELGSGTGGHAEYLARKGYKVLGIDLSPTMLQQAKARCSRLPAAISSGVQFCCSDIRSFHCNIVYDAVISLFHVFSYQTTNSDLVSTFETAKRHLRTGGIFFFDFWYGPAVLTDRPTTRVKRLECNGLRLVRISEPFINANENLIDVKYQIIATDTASGTSTEFKETHRMRYLFRPELEHLCQDSGFEQLAFGEWMTQREPGFGSWYAYFIARKI